MTKEIDAVAEAMKEQISKMMQSFKLPDVDMTALVEGQRKNIDAMAKVAQLTTDRATAISQRQLEIFRVTSENLSEMFRDMKLTGAERGEIAKKAFDTAMTNARELAEIRGSADCPDRACSVESHYAPCRLGVGRLACGEGPPEPPRAQGEVAPGRRQCPRARDLVRCRSPGAQERHPRYRDPAN